MVWIILKFISLELKNRKHILTACILYSLLLSLIVYAFNVSIL